MSDPIKALTDAVRGRVIPRWDSDYNEARAVYNAMHDRKPRAVMQCVDSPDVMDAVTVGRAAGLEVAIRGGGHSVPGFGAVEDGLAIDLSKMKSVRLDPIKKVARVGGGATWGDVDHATYPFGLAAPGGIISTTGVGGLTLGGGLGYLTRAVGLSIDNLLSADVVLADGRQVTASDYQNEDLFWALRGGGGNFGVVTSFEFQLHEVGDIVGGPLFYEVDDAAAVLQCYREFIAQAPEQLGCFFGWQIAPDLPFIPKDRVGGLFCVLVTCWNGPHEEAERLLKPLRDVAEVKAEQVDIMPFPALQRALDGMVPKGTQHSWKADFITELSDEAIAAHIEHGKKDSAHKLEHAPASDQRCGSTGRRRRGGLQTSRQELRPGRCRNMVGRCRQQGQHQVGEGLLRRYSSPLGQRWGLRRLHVERRRSPRARQLWRQLRAACSREGDL
ncbi:FAD-binding oxidoreductase [Ensifer aridi]|uniref:FAD-binding oxidoreductase n=1 Tax=Ensifer aridi TaxID=1708715 RepID=UPI00358EC307